MSLLMRAAFAVAVLLPVLACSDSPDNDALARAPAGADGGTGAGGAQQARVTGTGTSGLRIREKPTTASAQVGTLPEGELIAIDCQIEGETVNGNNVWNRIANEGGGYVSDAYVDGPRGFAKGARRCGAANPGPKQGPVVDGGAAVDIDGPAVKPHVQIFADEACTLQAACTASTYVGHQPRADLALDFLTSEVYGQVPTDNHAFGDRLAEFAVANQAKYRIEYVIYRQRINLGSGWRAMGDRGSVTQNHFDHVHVSFDP